MAGDQRSGLLGEQAQHASYRYQHPVAEFVSDGIFHALRKISPRERWTEKQERLLSPNCPASVVERAAIILIAGIKILNRWP
jgi:hypothetical protein